MMESTHGKTIVVSSPGKVIIHGEHAVVYGKMAIAVSLDLRTYLRITETEGEIQVCLNSLGKKHSWKHSQQLDKLFHNISGDPMIPSPPRSDVMKMLHELCDVDDKCVDPHQLALVSFMYLYTSILGKLGRNAPMLRFVVDSSLPIGVGLGSSGAYSTCLACGLLLYCGALNHKPVLPNSIKNGTSPWTSDELNLINSWSYQSEVILHGNPSGIDNSTSTYGGALSMKSHKIDMLGSIPELKILLTNTGVNRSCKQLISNVRHKYDKYRSIIEPVLESINAISETSKTYLTQNCQLSSIYSQIEDLITMNQHLLRLLDVSHPTIDDICSLTMKHELHSKLTGAGGGGCTLTLIPPGWPEKDLVSLKNDLKSHGYCCYEATIGGAGVLQHVWTV